MKHIFQSLTLSLLTLLLAVSCAGTGNQPAGEQPQNNIYARLFSIQGDTITIGQERYILYPRDSVEALKRSPYHIPYPVESVVCTATSYLPYFKMLSADQVIKGVDSYRYIYNRDIREKAERGEIYQVGYGPSTDFEKIMMEKPDILLANAVEGQDNGYIDQLRRLGVKVITLSEYLENHPLGKVEYLKLFGKLLGKEDYANDLFMAKQAEYLALADSIQKQTAGFKKIMTNLPVQGNWYIPGSINYMSLLVKDAGGEIAGSVEGESKSSTVQFEDALILAAGCDIWLNHSHSNFTTLKEIENENPLFKNLPMVQKGLVFSNNARLNEYGGNDFWESGAIYPELILRDLNDIINGRYDRLIYYRRMQ